MKWVGITGSIGSGKTTVSSFIEEQGYPVIRADEVARLITQKGSPGLSCIEQEFGPGFLTKSGELDRLALSKLVFENSLQLKKLESLLHPLIQKHVREWRETQRSLGQKLAFYDIPLLFENNLKAHFDSVVCVVSDEEQIIKRVMARSRLSRSEVLKRLSHQVPTMEKVKLSDYVIENNGSLKELKRKVLKLLRDLHIDHHPQE